MVPTCKLGTKAGLPKDLLTPYGAETEIVQATHVARQTINERAPSPKCGECEKKLLCKGVGESMWPNPGKMHEYGRLSKIATIRAQLHAGKISRSRLSSRLKIREGFSWRWDKCTYQSYVSWNARKSVSHAAHIGCPKRLIHLSSAQLTKA